MEALHAARIRDLETDYGFCIADDACSFAAELLGVYGSDMDPITLVEKACKTKSLDPDYEETSLDRDDYSLDRAYVEAMELRKEKSTACRTDALPRVERELAQIVGKMDNFMKKWSPILDDQKRESGKRRELLFLLSNQLVRIIKSTGSQEEFSGLPEQVNSILAALKHTVNAAFEEKLFVGPREIAQVASNLSGLPSKCFYWPFELRMMLPKLEDLKSRLSEKLIELDGVVHKIGFALLKQKSVMGPMGSFLLLGPHGCGRSKLAESLAEEIYGDKNKCIKYDVSLIREPNVFKKLLIDLAKFKKNGSVVMFRNIEDATDTFTREILPHILRTGNLSDGEGTSVSFSDDIILVSSHLGHEVFFDCECLHTTIPKLPFREILIEPALLHGGGGDEECHLHQFLSRVSNEYSSEFLDIFNDVLVFPWLSLQNHMAISRLQMRDAAESLGRGFNKPLIFYPSNAAVANLMRSEDITKRGAHAYEEWPTLFMKPKLLNMNVLRMVGDVAIIYIDELVGLRKEFSLRVENGSHLIKDPAHLRFKESLSKLRSRYREEKLHAYYIYKLQTICSHLCDLISTKNQASLNSAISVSRETVQLISRLMRTDGNEVVILDDSSSDEDVSLKTEHAKICFETVSRRLQSSSEQRYRASQAITEALLRKSDDSNHLPTSFLCLGLNPESKKQFAENLDENLLFQVDLSPCTQPESFFSMNTNIGCLLTEAVKNNPYSIVVFHKLEMAHMSVFSTVLSILDFGVAEDSEGNVTSFENCVVVIISDLGNREIISKLMNRDFPKSKSTIDQKEAKSNSEKGGVECSVSDNMVKQEAYGSSSTNEMGLRGLRFELLHRLDHILLFDPFSNEQLNRFAMLEMKELEEKSHSLHKAFSDLLSLKRKQKEDIDEIMQHIEGALGEVLKIRFQIL